MKHILLMVMNSLLLTAPVFAKSAVQIDYKKYLDKCGGRVYAKCDLPDLNQETIFNEALALAKKTNRNVLVNIGADWCPSCLVLDRAINLAATNNTQEAGALFSDYVLVKMEADRVSTKSFLSQKMKLSVSAYPTALIIESNTAKLMTHFLPGGATDIKSFQSMIGKAIQSINRAEKHISELQWTLKLSSLPIEFQAFSEIQSLVKATQKPIELDPLTQKHKISPIISSVYGETLATKYYRQGLFYLHSFAYLDAYRSFVMSINSNLNFYPSYLMIFQAGSQLGLGNYTDDLVPLTIAEQIKSKDRRLDYLDSYMSYLNSYSCEIKASDCKYLSKYRRAAIDIKQAQSEALLAATKENDFDVMILVTSNLKETAQQVLKLDPENVAAHHHLVHEMENNSRYQEAVIHAEKFVQIAPRIAHSHHMYGHVLPKVNKWKEAVNRFKVADQMHKAWSLKNKFPLSLDWHYEHNLNLLAHAYFFGGRLDLAESVWLERCNTANYRFCQEYINFLVLQNKGQKAQNILKSMLAKTRNTSDAFAKYATVSLEGMIEETKILDRIVNHADHKELVQIRNGVLSEEIEFGDSQFALMAAHISQGSNLESIEESITERLVSGGFDSWSEAVFDAELLQRVATRLGKKNLAANIRLIQNSVGFRCK